MAGPLALAFALTLGVPAARAVAPTIPYPDLGAQNAPESSNYKLAAGTTPSNFSETGNWELTATPDSSSGETVNNQQSDQLCGIRGISVLDSATTQPTSLCSTSGSPVKTAFEVSTGNPDVHIAVLDSGIEWNHPDVMANEAEKVWLNTGELPAPRHDLATPLAPLPGGKSCASLNNPTAGDYSRLGNYYPDGHGGEVGGGYDVIGNGVVNVLDWACDSRVAAAMSSPRRHGPANTLTPEDLILAFSDGADHDHNGYANDIAGWNYVDNNNDPFDDVQYGHGSGEARDSTAAANTGSTIGTCPNCMVMPLRVGESFVADANRFAQAVLYATDNNADVIQEALGTYNAPYFARQAIEYAYQHGTTVIASAADEEAEHHNQPGSLPDTIVVNSVNRPEENIGPVNATGTSYLQLNGCTNFTPRVDIAVEGSSCSSESTGKSSGVTGLVYSAAENALAAHKISAASNCTRPDGTPCIITPNEVRQLLASGNVAGDATPGQTASNPGTTSADQGAGQADDVNFAQQPEPSCAATPTPNCTDPNSNVSYTTTDPTQPGGLIGPDTYQYPARKGFDEFYGYGRLNAYKAVAAAAGGDIPPEADITSPDWFQQIDPSQSSFNLNGYVNARGSNYTCRVEVAPGAEPNNSSSAATPAGDFHQISSSYCDGTTSHTAAYNGLLASVSVSSLKSLFPPGNPGSFNGNENGGIPQTQSGRPNTQPYGFTVRVVVNSSTPVMMAAEDRRQLYLHRDQQMLPGWPKELQADGDSSPILADIEGSNRNDLIVATSDGWVHAYRSDGSEAPGWPVHTQPLPSHAGEAAYNQVGNGHYNAILGGLAAGDLYGNGSLEVVADDMGGNVYAWNGKGQLVFHTQSNPKFSGAPLDYPSNPTGALDNVRHGPRDRTEGGFVSAPVLAKLGGPTGPLDIVVSGEDRHLYAWQPNGQAAPGFPVLVADPDKLTGVDPTTNHLAFSTTKAIPNPGIEEDQGKLIDTPAVAHPNGLKKPPVIYVGSNEEYTANKGNEGPINASDTSLGALGQSGLLSFANGRMYAIKAAGGAMKCNGASCNSSAFTSGWPVKVGIIDEGLLPDVGEGINGSPVVAPVTCSSGGAGMKVGVSPDAGPAYVLNANGSSCYGSSNGQYNTLAIDDGSGVDHPAFAAVGYPAFGTLDGKTISMFDQGAGAVRALDVAVNGEQRGGQDFILGWNPSSSQFSPGYPAVVNDLGFLTGETVGDVTGGSPSQEVLGGTASLDVQAFNASGQPASSAWPKLTGDWLVATPTLGSFGTLDYTSGAHRDVVTVTRSGTLAVYSTPAKACAAASWPNWHHDIANSGDYTRDAVPPGAPMQAKISGGKLSFVSPGNDLLCGKPAYYEVVTAGGQFTAAQVPGLRHLTGVPAAAQAGKTVTMTLPANVQDCIGIRAVDAAGNVGPTAVIARHGAHCGPPIALPGSGHPHVRVRVRHWASTQSTRKIIHISWRATPGAAPISYYTLYYRKRGSHRWRKFVRKTTLTHAALTGRTGSTYLIKVTAVDATGSQADSQGSSAIPIDDHSSRIHRSGHGWTEVHSRRAYYGSFAQGGAGAAMTLRFFGSEAAVIGPRLRHGGVLLVRIGNRRWRLPIHGHGQPRDVLFAHRLRQGFHEIRVTVVSGTIGIDAIGVSRR